MSELRHPADVVDYGSQRGVSTRTIGPSRFYVVDRQVPEPNADSARPSPPLAAVTLAVRRA